jgi:RNA polymerase sigma-70 factor (ECF subfamily)
MLVASLHPLEVTSLAVPAATAESLYRDHRDRVYRLCLRLGGGNVGWAEDATHDVFVKLIEHLPALDASEELGGWIYRVAVNTCMTRLRRDGSIWRRVQRALLAAVSAPSTAGSPERRVELRHDLAAALAQIEELPAKERVVFCMRYLDEKSQQQIALDLALSEGYVSKLLGRARAQLERARDRWEVPRA